MDELKHYNLPDSGGASPGYDKGKKRQGPPVAGKKATSKSRGMDKSGLGDGRTPSKKRTKPC